MSLILASNSQIRREMLCAAGIEFLVRAPEVDEARFKQRGLVGEQLAALLAEKKAVSVPASPADWVIGSDSTVSVDGRLYSKPRDREEATAHLRCFSSSTIYLSSAVALTNDGRVDWSHVETARLQVRNLSEAFIQSYLDAEWPDVGHCVGVFRMEGRGVTLFNRVDGDHFTVLGMPLLPLLGALRDRRLIPA